MLHTAADLPWVIGSVKGQLFAFSTTEVKELVSISDIHVIPHQSQYMRGLTNIRGEVMQVIDLRRVIGYDSQLDEMLNMLIEREADHKKWLVELEQCVQEERTFKLAIDPHKCGFGKWYDNFSTDDLLLRSILQKFDEPHQQIHKTAKEVLSLKKDDAIALIEEKRTTTLQTMIDLFQTTRAYIKDNFPEYGMIIEKDTQNMVVIIDSVASVEYLLESSIEKTLPEIEQTDTDMIAPLVGKRKSNNEFVLIVDTDILRKKI